MFKHNLNYYPKKLGKEVNKVILNLLQSHHNLRGFTWVWELITEKICLFALIIKGNVTIGIWYFCLFSMVMLKLLESDVRYLNMKKFRGTTCFCISSACHIYLCFLSSVVSQLVRWTKRCTLIAENKRRPQLTSIIAASSGAMKADEVAKRALDGIKSGSFFVPCNFEGSLLAIATAGLSPQRSFLVAFIEVVAAGLIRLVALFFQWNWFGSIEKWHAQKK